MQTIVAATSNRGKLKEFRQIFCNYTIVSMKEIGFDGDIDEPGESFMENAIIKARFICKKYNMIAMADDSGLCVDALDGAPGLYSARFSGVNGEHGDDESNNDLLLKLMEGKENRAAHYISAMAIAKPDGSLFCFEGRTDGHILTERHGTNGFGYDPIFFSDELGKSFGEATDEEKNAVSHRYRAMMGLKEKIRREV